MARRTLPRLRCAGAARLRVGGPTYHGPVGQTRGDGEAVIDLLNWSPVLKTAIVLYGLRIPLDAVAQLGPAVLVLDAWDLYDLATWYASEAGGRTVSAIVDVLRARTHTRVHTRSSLFFFFLSFPVRSSPVQPDHLRGDQAVPALFLLIRPLPLISGKGAGLVSWHISDPSV